MKATHSILLQILVLQLLAALSDSQLFDFFYFVQQRPGSYCDTKQSCCYPKTGKPKTDFGIHGLWPNYNDGSYPSNCDPDSSFDASTISDLTRRMQSDWPSLACPSSNGLKFWSHEWEKHGTCSESVLDQHGYFEAALNLKKKVDLLQILENAGIQPDGELYSLRSIKEAISDATGYSPRIECNVASPVTASYTRFTFAWTNLGPISSSVPTSRMASVVQRSNSLLSNEMSWIPTFLSS